MYNEKNGIAIHVHNQDISWTGDPKTNYMYYTISCSWNFLYLCNTASFSVVYKLMKSLIENLYMDAVLIAQQKQ